MNYIQYLFEVLAAVMSKSASFRLGPGTVTVTDTSGAPAHLTFNQVEAAVGLALSGSAASITSGDITISYAVNKP